MGGKDLTHSASGSSPEDRDRLQHEERLARILAEIHDRQAAGELVDVSDILRRHPELAGDLQDLLEASGILEGLVDRAERREDFGDFRDLRRLGGGAYGVVYEAWQVSMDRPVALKFLSAARPADPRALERFEREAKVAGKLRHPNIVSVYALGIERGVPYYAMELVEGLTLDQELHFRRIHDSGRQLKGEGDTHLLLQSFLRIPEDRGASPLPPSQVKLLEATEGDFDPGAPGTENLGLKYCRRVAEAFAGVADGLHYAHQNGVIHRDLKPSNLILDREGRLRILDFGLAWLEGQERLTRADETVGTPLYMSPEQAEGRPGATDHRTDIYSLGASLYEMLTFRPPLRGDSVRETLYKIAHSEPLAPRRWSPQVPRDLETIVLKCLAKEPRSRYRTAEAVAQDLRRFARGEPIEARSRTWSERVFYRARKHRERLAAGLLIALLALAVAVLWRGSQRAAQRQVAERYESTVLSASMEMQLGALRGPGLPAGPVSVDPEGLLVDGDFRPLIRMIGQSPQEKAIAQLREMTGLLPSRPDAYYHLARGLFILGEPESALIELERALRSDAGFVPALALEAGILERLGRSGEASEKREKAKLLGGSGWTETWLAAQLAVSERRWEDAARAYGQILESQAELRRVEPYIGLAAEAFLGRGSAYLELRRHDRAEEDFLAVRWQWPEALVPQLLLGKTHVLSGDRPLAEQRFRELHRRSGSTDEVALAVAAVYTSVEDYASSRDWVKRVGSASIRTRSLTALHCLLESWSEAIQAGREALQLQADDPVALRNLGLALVYGGGSLTEARDCLRRAIEADPRDARACFILGVILEKQGQTAGAIEKYDEAIDLDPTFSQAHANLGQARFALGEWEAARRAFEESIRLAPKALKARYGLASALDAMGASWAPEAMAALRTAIELDPRHAWTRGKVAALLGRGALAAFATEVRGLVEAFAELHPGIGDPSQLDQMARQHLQDPRRESLLEALGFSLLAVRNLAERERLKKDPTGLLALPDVLTTLAGVHSLAGNAADAVLTMEEALRSADVLGVAATRLEGYRRALLPDLASPASIDAALETRVADLPAFEAAARERGARDLLAYLRGRLAQRAGSLDEAIGAFDEASRAAGEPGGLEATRSESALRIIECLRAAGRPREAAARAAAALEAGQGQGPDETWWRPWFAAHAADLGLGPAEILVEMARVPRGPRPSFRADLAWALGQLAEGGALRLNCGGDDYTSPATGLVWGRDRFCAGGITADAYNIEIAGSEDKLLYKSNRWFRPGTLRKPAYRIPLPAGKYRVTLHFAETWFKQLGQRRFDVLAEGRPVLEGHEPLAAGFGVAHQRSFEVSVVDGTLDLELVHRVDCPKISGIEVLRAP